MINEMPALAATQPAPEAAPAPESVPRTGGTILSQVEASVANKQVAGQAEPAPRSGGTILSTVEAGIAKNEAAGQAVVPSTDAENQQPNQAATPESKPPAAGQTAEALPGISDQDIDNKLDALVKDKNIKSPGEQSRMVLREMAFFDLIKDEAQLERLAQLSPEDLQKQPEYQEMFAKNKDTLLANLALDGKTKSGRNKAELAKIFAEAFDFDGFDPDNPDATVGTILAKMDEKAATPEEKKKGRSIFMRMALASARYASEFIQGSLEDSSFSDFLKNFWEEVDTSNQGWDRYNQRSGETGAEMFSITQVEEFFKSSKDLHKTLELTFEGLTKADPQLAREIPAELRESADNFTSEKLLKVLMELQHSLKEFGDPAKKVFEHALGEAMNRAKPEGVVIDQRFFVKLEEMASNPQSDKGKKTYADFASHTFPKAA